MPEPQVDPSQIVERHDIVGREQDYLGVVRPCVLECARRKVLVCQHQAGVHVLRGLRQPALQRRPTSRPVPGPLLSVGELEHRRRRGLLARGPPQQGDRIRGPSLHEGDRAGEVQSPGIIGRALQHFVRQIPCRSEIPFLRHQASHGDPGEKMIRIERQHAIEPILEQRCVTFVPIGQREQIVRRRRLGLQIDERAKGELRLLGLTAAQLCLPDQSE